MNILLEKENELSFSIGEYYHYLGDGVYQAFCGGKTGACGPGVAAPTPPAMPSYIPPPILSFTIRLLKSDQELYQRLATVIENQKKMDTEIAVSVTAPRVERVRNPEPRPEFREKVEEIERNNQMTQMTFDNLVSQLQKLGADTSDVYPPRMTSTDDFYEFTEIVNYQGAFTICCHRGTATHQWLHRKGFLHRYYSW